MKEKLKFWAQISDDSGPISGLEKVVCQIILPKKPRGEVFATFFPTIEQAKAMEELWEFSFRGQEKRIDGKVIGSIVGEKALNTKTRERWWDADLANIRCFATVEQLTIDTLLDRDAIIRPRVQARFWITPNRMLSDSRVVEHHYLKGILIKNRRTHIRVQLANGMRINFKKYLRFQSKDKETVVYDELVGEYDLHKGRKGVRSIDADVLNEVDDLLALTSFASRHPCICVGWDYSNNEVYSRVYRGNRGISVSGDESLRDALIDVSNFKSFVQPAYQSFHAHPARDSLRQALYRVSRVHGNITERTFVSLYSAIETLIYEFREQSDLSFVISNKTKWKKLKRQLTKAISALAAADELLSEDRLKREHLYEKLDELNRVSFGTALRSFSMHYDIDLSDLWPLAGGSGTLSDIRNRLVHGYRFQPSTWRLLISAHENLRWAAERMILAMLGWPVSKSNAHQTFLGLHNNVYQEWGCDYESLKSMIGPIEPRSTVSGP